MKILIETIDIDIWEYIENKPHRPHHMVNMVEKKDFRMIFNAKNIISSDLSYHEFFRGSQCASAKNVPATMTRNNLYWLSHDQVTLFKTFRGTASRCKQTINHAVPRIKQSNSLLYDILLHYKNRSRIHQKIWLPVPIPKYPQYWNHVPTLVPRKERERRRPEMRRQKIWREKEKSNVRPPTDPPSNGPEKVHLRRGGNWGADPSPQIPVMRVTTSKVKEVEEHHEEDNSNYS
ncbi:hypothetical protein Lal_00032528 [Lupinus albus]|nr:hypothetical protein Lal_00032528 [Lupinus albus]